MYWLQKLKYVGALLVVLFLLAVASLVIINIDAIVQFLTPTLDNLTDEKVKGRTIFEVLIFITSLVAFGLSLINYFDSSKPADIKVFPGERSVIWVNAVSIGLHIPITFVNFANNAGVVNRCSLNVINNTSKESKTLTWGSFCKDEGKKWESESQIYPLAIEGKTSLKKVVTFVEDFSGDNKLDLKEGSYTLVFLIWLAGKKNVYYKTEFTMNITSKILDFINNRKTQFPNQCNSGHVFITISEK